MKAAHHTPLTTSATQLNGGARRPLPAITTTPSTTTTNGNNANGPRTMKELSHGAEPPETDLDYYSRPENYGGSNLQSLQRFILARDKQHKPLQQSGHKKKRRKEEDDLFRRYRHILAPHDSLRLSSSSSASEDDDDDRFKVGTVNGKGSVPGDAGRNSRAGLSLAVSEAHRPLSDFGRLPDSDNPFSDDADKRSASAGDGVTVPQPGSHVTADLTPDLPHGNKDFAATTALNSDPTLNSSSPSPSDATTTTVGLEMDSAPSVGALTASTVAGGKKVWARTLVKNRFAALTAEAKSKQVSGSMVQSR